VDKIPLFSYRPARHCPSTVGRIQADRHEDKTIRCAVGKGPMAARSHRLACEVFLFECFPYVLSRACVGKRIIFIYKWLKNTSFLPAGGAPPRIE
jgi:hypothetical protein